MWGPKWNIPKINFSFFMKNILFTLPFIAGKIKYNFASEMVGVNPPIKKC